MAAAPFFTPGPAHLTTTSARPTAPSAKTITLTQTHELRLKIDASAAQSGSRDFTNALAAVKKAVRDLDKDSSGLFTQLRKVDTSGIAAATTATEKLATSTSRVDAAASKMAADIQRTALASASAIRMAEQATQRLALRMSDGGMTHGVDALNAALATMKGQLVNATSVLDTRRAKSSFDDLRSSLLQMTVSAEYAQGGQAQIQRELEATSRAADQQAQTLQRLRASHDPLYASSMRYSQALTDVQTLVTAGAVSETQASAMRDRAAQSYLAVGNAADFAAASMQRGTAATMQGVMAGHQFSDILVTSQMGFQSVGMIALQQGSQLAAQMQSIKATGGSVFKTLLSGVTSLINPLSLATIALVAVAAAAAKWAFSAGDAKANTESLSKSFDTLESRLSAHVNAANLAKSSTVELTRVFGDQTASIRENLRALEEHSYLSVVAGMQDSAKQVQKVYADLFSAISRAETSPDIGGHTGRNIQINMARALASVEMTRAEATRLRDALNELGTAAGPEEARKVFASILTTMQGAYESVEAMPRPMRELHQRILEADLAAAKLMASQNGTTSATDDASGAASNLAATIGTAADAAADLLRNLGSVPGALAIMGRSVEGQIDGIRAQNRALNLELTEGLSSLAANRRVQLEVMVTTATERGQRITPDAVAAEWAKVNELDAVAKEQERLRKQISDANRPAKASGGGGGGRTANLTEEESALARLKKSVADRVLSLNNETVALRLVASGQVDSIETARLMADAMAASGGAVDAQTAAMISQIDAASKLNAELQKLASDPVKEWMNGVPGWIEAGKTIEMGAIDSLKSALSEMMQTGKMDVEALGSAILGTISEIVADKAVKELLTLTNSDGALSGLIGSLGLQSAGDTDMSDLATSAGPAGQTIAAVLMQSAPSIGSAIASGMAGIGPQIATSAQSGLTAGSNTVRQAGQQGLAAGANSIRIAATTGGPILGRGVVSGAQAGAPILAQGVAMGAQAGGMGSGIVEGLGGWGGIASMVLGAFSEGGYSTSPVGTATMPAAAFRHAPSYAEGTANTSGIPAILHPSEAVVPLSRGRAIPVDLGDNAGGQSVVQHMTFHIQTNDADSFKRSQKQIAADMARAGQTALRQNG